MRFVAVLVVVLALGGSVASAAAGPPGSAHQRPAPAGLPNVLCREPTFPGRAKPTTPGIYSYRPGSCVLETYGTSQSNESTTHLLSIEWKRWNARSARGIGLIPLSVIDPETNEQWAGREHVLIILGRPVTKCGRSVFTQAHIDWIGGDFDYGFRLHRVPVVGHGCP